MSTPNTPKTSDTAGKAKSDTQTPEARMKKDLQNAAKDVKNAATEQAEEAKGAVRREIEEAGAAVRANAEAQYDNARTGLASTAEDTASRLREAGDAFGADSFAHAVADRLAENLSQAASAVRDTDIGTLQQDVTEFARRNPLVFFGGAALLGFFAARMVKASERAEPGYPPAPQPHDLPEYQGSATSPRPTHGYTPQANSRGNATDRDSWGYSQ